MQAGAVGEETTTKKQKKKVAGQLGMNPNRAISCHDIYLS